MEVEYRNKNYFIKEKIENQTMLMEFERLASRPEDTTLYYNISLSIYNKRKHADSDMDNKKITGLNPFLAVSKARKAHTLLEEAIISELGKYYDICFLVFWTDNRRRDAYSRILTPRGYKIERLFGTKCLCKRIPKGE